MDRLCFVAMAEELLEFLNTFSSDTPGLETGRIDSPTGASNIDRTDASSTINEVLANLPTYLAKPNTNILDESPTLDDKWNQEKRPRQGHKRGRPPGKLACSNLPGPSGHAVKVGDDRVIDYGLDYHQPKQRFQCSVCLSYAAKKRYDVMRHIRYVHTFDKQHKCSYCDKTFAASGALRKHERRHKQLCRCAARERQIADRNGDETDWAYCTNCEKPVSQALIDQKIKSQTIVREPIAGEKRTRVHEDLGGIQSQLATGFHTEDIPGMPKRFKSTGGGLTEGALQFESEEEQEQEEQCPICGKVYRSEKIIRMHYEVEHPDMLDVLSEM